MIYFITEALSSVAFNSRFSSIKTEQGPLRIPYTAYLPFFIPPKGPPPLPINLNVAHISIHGCLTAYRPHIHLIRLCDD